MTQYLPPNLLALFAPRDPIPYLPPPDKLVSEKKRTPYRGLAQYLSYFEDPKDKPPPVKVETKSERIERKVSRLTSQLVIQNFCWNPNNNPEATSDPYKTLFVSRISYDTSEAKLRREFETYGPLKKVCMVKDKAENPRGYAFLEFERERDMHAAYKHADGRKIDGRRVLVDVERGRTVKGWLPRRLGGGLGDTRRARAPGGISRRDKDRYDDYKKHNRENSYRNDRRHDSRSDSISRDRRHQGFRMR
ncbi:U1 small nuclear ribonucleoprotein 70 kDa [Trichuris trichiura]|uniref:U1 small nuclear ribonucleoprotein 70 kDa n=1 Tax=Trichuris trichiura TaxID=36087 RepID=A0A077ZIY6_TRITR|nr:U1 small nuclear ribonucleoprotein 70 kDa [Trichuris trichiura]